METHRNHGRAVQLSVDDRKFASMLEIFWKFFGNFLEISWKFLGNFSEISWKFFGNFLEIFSKFFRNFLEISWKFFFSTERNKWKNYPNKNEKICLVRASIRMLEVFAGQKKLRVYQLHGPVFLHVDGQRSCYLRNSPLNIDYYTVIVRRGAEWLGYSDVSFQVC